MCTWFHIKKIWKVKDMACGTWRSVNRKLNESKRGLKVWQKVHGRNVGQHIQLLSAKLLEEKAKQDDVNPNLIKKLHEELIEKQNEEDVYWRQRAKEDWLKHGDQNSRYFHASANQKKKASMMTVIMDEQGNKWETEELIRDAFAK
jgi:Fic family protein